MIKLIEGRGWQGLPPISKHMYQDTYFLADEDYDQWVERIATAYSNDANHKAIVSTLIKNYYFHPSTPPSSNGGTDRGLPISCYVGDVHDSKKGIFASWNEACWLGAMAGGIGRNWSAVRELGAKVSDIGSSSGIIPFMHVDNALSLAIAQGGIRRMSQADYLKDSHPEIEEFIDIRKPTGDANRRSHSLHHGVVISDALLNAAIKDEDWPLISPKTKKVTSTVKAKTLWHKILEQRTSTGEPYIMFYDNVNHKRPEEYKTLGLTIELTNLCTEIFLNTSPEKTNVCCLSSLNLEYWDEYKDHLDIVIPAVIDFLDNILQDFINKTENMEGFANARRAAIEERALGLGVMGFHSLLQKKSIPFESAMASGINQNIFKLIREHTEKHQLALNQPCPLAKKAGTHRRNIVSLAIAPTMSISNLCGFTSSGIEPLDSNAFTKKLKQGSFPIVNKFFLKVLTDHAEANGLDADWIDAQLTSVKKNEGSVQHLEWLSSHNKDVFKTCFEIDQRWIIDHADTRGDHIDQGQSVNLFLYGNSHVQDIADLHIYAWRRGLKSLYYLRSKNPERASSSSTTRKVIATTYDECLSCQ